MKKNKIVLPSPEKRVPLLVKQRNQKMARSAHAYVRGNTTKFYEWLDHSSIGKLPQGPAIWICGDCHVGNIGPTASIEGNIDIQIRDFDQTVIGNPAHDLIRLGLSLATAARGSDLPGITTVKMLEALIIGYEQSFCAETAHSDQAIQRPKCVTVGMVEASKRSWKHLARERIDNMEPTIPLGKRFWPLSKDERQAISTMFEKKVVTRLATTLRSREDDAEVSMVDAAYWVKGCSSLGKLRFAVLLDVGKDLSKDRDLCLIDIKEAITASAPHYPGKRMPRKNGERVVEGARHLSPYLGERMLATEFLGQSVFLRELLPQDLKLEIDQLTRTEAMRAARFLASVVGKAHARQMDARTRMEWKKELSRNRSKKLDAPSWLWNSIVELAAGHEANYLEHCRNYVMQIEESAS